MGRLTVRHAAFAAALAGAAALRGVVMLGYPCALWFNDSYSYVRDAVRHIASPERVSGYPVLLALLEPVHSFVAVVVVQHLLGLAMGVALYAVLRRRGLPGWGATLAAVPVLFDAYQVQVEHQVMSDTLFMGVLVGAVALACWRDVPRTTVLAGAGLLAGYAALVRSVGLALIPVMAACLLPRGGWRRGWRPAAAMLAGGIAPIALYASVYQVQHGRFALTDSGGVFLYGRVMSFADCAAIRPPSHLAVLCDRRPPSRRPIAVEYVWSRSDPLRRLGTAGLFTPRVDALAGQFARRAILAQPGDYLATVADDALRAFGWRRAPGYDRKTAALYRFSDPPPPIRRSAHWRQLRAYQPGLGQPRAVQPYARFLRAYQSQAYLRGAMLGLLLLTGLAGVAARWREGGGPGLMPWAMAVVLLVAPIATSGFSYRYLLAVTPFAALAAGLAFSRAPGATARRSAAREAGYGTAAR